MSEASNQGSNFVAEGGRRLSPPRTSLHIIRWGGPRRTWGFDKFYGYETTYYALSLGRTSFQIERPGR